MGAQQVLRMRFILLMPCTKCSTRRAASQHVPCARMG
jgi:hypothetical protein